MRIVKRQGVLAVLVVLAVVAGLLVAALPAGAQAPESGVKIQMVICLDGSSSIDASEWAIIKEGTADAVKDPSVVPQDGSVELGVNKFGYTAQTGGIRAEEVVAMTVIDSQATADAVAAAIMATSKPDGWTPTGSAINLATSMMQGSPNWSVATRHIINIATDGAPAGPGEPPGYPVSRQEAIDQRNAAIAAGVTEIHAEMVGASAADVEWMRANIVYPQPGVIAPPYDPQYNGFVVQVASKAEFVNAIKAKLAPPSLTLDPPTATNPVRTMHTVTATLTDGLGNPIPGATIDFEVVAGPNTGKFGSSVTNASGVATWSYTDTAATNQQTDTIRASRGDLSSVPEEVYKTWVEETPPPVPTASFWGITATVAVLGVLGIVMLHRRRAYSNN